MTREKMMEAIEEVSGGFYTTEKMIRFSDRRLESLCKKYGVFDQRTQEEVEMMALLDAISTTKKMMSLYEDDSFNGDIFGAVSGLYADSPEAQNKNKMEYELLQAKLSLLQKKLEENTYWKSLPAHVKSMWKK